MANEEHLNKLKEGVLAWNQWMGEHPDMQPGLYSANLRGADLHNAGLRRAGLYNADLSNADLSHADLSYADLSYANLSNADLSDTMIGSTSFGDCDLREIKGLETIKHLGRSPLSINTIYLSEGDIPEAFVRGTGAPETFIDYMHSLVGKPNDRVSRQELVNASR